jgi:plastocyanin
VAPRLALVALLVALEVGAGAARADNPVLTGVVGTNDAFQISLSDATGTVAHLDPGTYTLVVHDRSTIHNFHLIGPGVDVATTVEDAGDATFTVTLTDGTYTFRCDAHALQMKGTFTVGSVSTPPPPPPPPPAPAVAKLAGALSGSKATLSGTAGLSAGTARFTVVDRSKTDAFLLRGPGVSKKTGVAFTGKVSWTVTLQAGTYVYGSVKRPAARHRFTVSV